MTLQKWFLAIIFCLFWMYRRGPRLTRVPIARFLITRIFKIPPKILITQTFTMIFMTHFYISVPLLTQVFPSTKNYVNGGVSVVQEFFKGSHWGLILLHRDQIVVKLPIRHQWMINLFLFIQRNDDEKFNFQTKLWVVFLVISSCSRKFQSLIWHKFCK